MHAVVVVWVVWIGLVLALSAVALVRVPDMAAPPRWQRLRSRVAPVVTTMRAQLGRAGTAAVVYLFGAAVIVAVCWPAGLLAHGLQGPVDWPLFHWFQDRQSASWSDFWLKATNIGKPRITQGFTAVAAVFFAVVWARRGLKWWFPLLALPLGYALEKYTQIIIQDVVHRGHPPTTHGTFPSGGCARVMVVYGMIIFLTVAWRWPHVRRAWVAGWCVLACLVSVQAYARLYNLEHWSTDVAGGVLFGLLLLLVMTSCLRILCSEPVVPHYHDAAPLPVEGVRSHPPEARRQERQPVTLRDVPAAP